MSTIVTRADKDSPLTNTEVDANFTNLNTDKAETDGATLTNVDINSGTIDGVTIGGASAGAITGTTITGTSFVSSGDMTFGDNDKAIFGAGSDLQIYHDGANSIVQDAGTGQLYLGTNGSFVGLYDFNNNQDMLRAFTGGDVIINQAGTERFRTTSTGIDVTGTVTQDANLLRAIDSSIAVTAVDVFVYDTRKDSDGGAWRKRTQHTSWYNETLNTDTRGSRREFPAVAVIVLHTNRLEIYDGDNPELPRWMLFYPNNDRLLGGVSGFTSVFALNGKIGRGGSGSSYDFVVIDFVGDRGARAGTTSIYGPYKGNISQRNSNSGWQNGTVSFLSNGPIVSRTVNDVAMTVLPNAPIDSATGLPIPTIAVATAGGVSVIKDDGTVVSSSSTRSYSDLVILDTFAFHAIWNAGESTDYFNDIRNLTSSFATSKSFNSVTVPKLNVAGVVSTTITAINGGFVQGTNSNKSLNVVAVNPTSISKSSVAYISSTYNTGWMNGDIKGAFLSDTDDTDVTGSELVTNGTFDTDLTGWSTYLGSSSVVSQKAQLNGNGTTDSNLSQAISTVIGETYRLSADVYRVSGSNSYDLVVSNGSGAAFNTSILSQISSSTNTSEQTKTITFVATQTTTYVGVQINGVSSVTVVSLDNVSVKLADADRSVNNNGLIVNGTITRTAVATGADLVAYSGFSASNYLEQPYNSALDFGTGDFAIIGWIKEAANSAVETILERDSATTAQRFTLAVNASGFLTFTCDDDTTARTATSTIAIDNDTWTHFVVTYDGAGGLRIYLNSALNDTETGAALLTLNNASAVLRVGLAVDGAEPLTNGSLALLRISATVPSNSQIQKIYEDEKFLFQDNAQATLYGASDAVTALAYDDSTNLLHVGTSAGRSVFSGLRRVDNTTDAVGTAISASNGMVVEE